MSRGLCTTEGRIAPGASGNPRGGPSMVGPRIAADLLRLGATQQEIDGLLKAPPSSDFTYPEFSPTR